MPGKHNFTVWRGNTGAISFYPFDTGGSFDHTGSTWHLVARSGATAIIDKTATIGGDGLVTFTFTVADSNLVPLGAVLKYEIERRIASDQTTWLYGHLVGDGGGSVDD